MAETKKKGVDIGVYTSDVTLEHKLEAPRRGRPAEATWNMGRLPKELGKGDTADRLFFATDGYWQGYFLLKKDVLYNPGDEKKPYSLIFDTGTWTDIAPIPVKKFRGFRYLDDMPV